MKRFKKLKTFDSDMSRFLTFMQSARKATSDPLVLWLLGQLAGRLNVDASKLRDAAGTLALGGTVFHEPPHT